MARPRSSDTLFFGRGEWCGENRLLFEGVLEELQMPDR